MIVGMLQILAVALLITPAPVLQDGFETPAVTGGSQRFPAGTTVGPWTVTRGDVALSTTALWQTAEGRQNLDLDGAISRTFPVTPLLTYRISYALGGNYVGGPAVKTGEVRVNGTLVQKMAFDTTGRSRDDMGYTRQSVHVLAKSTAMALSFASTTTPGGFGPLIDDVRVDSCVLVLCPKSGTVAA